MKMCTKCHITKPLTEFYKRSKTADGLAYRCKTCQVEHATQYHKTRRAVDIEFRRRQMMNTNESIKRSKAIDPAYKAAWQERAKNYNYNRKKTDPEYRERQLCNARTRYQSNRKDKAYRDHYSLCRKQHLVQQFKALSAAEQSDIIMFYTNCPKGYHLDHIYPVSKGGLHCVSNLQYLPAHINLTKSATIPANTDIDGTPICWS